MNYVFPGLEFLNVKTVRVLKGFAKHVTVTQRGDVVKEGLVVEQQNITVFELSKSNNVSCPLEHEEFLICSIGRGLFCSQQVLTVL